MTMILHIIPLKTDLFVVMVAIGIIVYRHGLKVFLLTKLDFDDHN